MSLFANLILPLQAVYEFLYLACYAVLENYGLALLLLSVLTSLLLRPLERWAQQYVRLENELQEVLRPQLETIRQSLHGQEQQAAVGRLYKRYGYSPLYAVRQALPILVQLPLLIGAYWALENFAPISGVGFMGIDDLGKADGLLFGVNLLPFVMTFINLLTGLLSPDLSRRERTQSYVIALLFLLLLYNACAALLIYWSGNNLLALLKVLYRRYAKRGTAFDSHGLQAV